MSIKIFSTIHGTHGSNARFIISIPDALCFSRRASILAMVRANCCRKTEPS
ncbi:MAG: hypothetical protein NTV68_00880 [Methanomicrobiales archaeon]|nr:hypothetical protein [Methanomicrobiales archaeon]